MYKLFFSLAIILNVKAQCLLKSNANQEVNFKAYKTYQKVGVGGKFTKVTYNFNEAKKNLNEQVSGLTFTINTKDLNTANEQRDQNILNSFFANIPAISGKVVAMTAKELKIDLQFLKAKKTIPFSYVVENNKLKVKGNIDVLEFGLSKNLADLNKACFALHEGKTWSDVEITFEVDLGGC